MGDGGLLIEYIFNEIYSDNSIPEINVKILFVCIPCRSNSRIFKRHLLNFSLVLMLRKE